MAPNLPTPENFPAQGGMSAKKFEAEKKEGRAEQTEQRETLDDAIDQGLDQAQAAADIFHDDMHSKLQAINNQGAMLKQKDQQMLQNLISQSKAITNDLKTKLSQLQGQSSDQDDSDQESSQ